MFSGQYRFLSPPGGSIRIGVWQFNVYTGSKLIGLVAALVVIILLNGCRSPQPMITPGTISRVDLVAQNAGIYAVRAKDLMALGFSNVSQFADRLSISVRGEKQPFLIEGSGESARLIYFVKPSDSRYSQEDTYVLEMLDSGGGALPIPNGVQSEPVLEAGQSLSTDTALSKRHLEENNTYNPQSEIADRWLWQTILGKNQFEYAFELAALVDGPAEMRIELWSNSQAALDPDHHLMVILNGTQVADYYWDGRGPQSLSVDIPTGVLMQGSNTIKLVVPGDTGAPAELNHLDSIDVTYTRNLSLQSGQITFLGSGSVKRPAGYSGQVVVAVVSTDNSEPGIFWLEEGMDLQTEEGTTYWLASQESLLTPVLRLPRLAPNLYDSALSADYLAIGPEDLLAELAPLLELRQSQGLRVLQVPVEAIYDQFGYGFAEPVAITQFLRQTRNWQNPPDMILLVGDATFDPAQFTTGPEMNRLPVFFVQTSHGGETASDLGFTQLDQDTLPDIAVGRLPASTPDQVKRYVAKVLAYEASRPDAKRRVLAISDGTEPGFRDDAQDFLNQLGSTEQTELLAAVPGDGAAASVLQSAFRDGLSMVAYFGHGSVTLWGKDKIFSAEEALGLTNQNYPVVMTMTCLNGLFTHPKSISLAENLLWAPNGGAVAVLAPTSLTLAVDQAAFRQPFVEAVFTKNQTLGQALLTAQRSVGGQRAALDEVAATFLLFGDPALKLK